MVTGIGIVSAETLTGTLGGYNITAGSVFDRATSSADPIAFSNLSVGSIELTNGLKVVIRTDADGSRKAVFKDTTTAGQVIPITITYGINTVGTGQFGYQRRWDNAYPTPAEIIGYQYITFDTWNITGLTGNLILNVSYDVNATQFSYMPKAASGTPPAGTMVFSSGSAGGGAGAYQMFYDFTTYANYIATKPEGLRIAGNVTKSVDGVNYPSRAYVLDGVSGVVVSSQATITSSDFNFTVSNEQIKIAIQDSQLNWYNSSTLFSAGSGTPTPTPTPTPTVTLNPGEFWLTFSAEDATTGGLIPGAEIDIYSEFASTWNNATTTTGERTIASSQGHVYDAYGSATGYTNGSALDKIAYPNQNYLVKLFPSTGLPDVPGYVNLFVSVTERETGSPISGVSVTVSTPGSYTVNGETDNTGSEVFSTSNSSVKYITVSKSGYKSETRTITTPASGSYNAALQMSRALVTTQPTSYIPPGGVTPQITVDPRSSTEKDQDMMNLVRDAGPNLIQLAIVVTMISLLGLMTKGFGK